MVISPGKEVNEGKQQGLYDNDLLSLHKYAVVRKINQHLMNKALS